MSYSSKDIIILAANIEQNRFEYYYSAAKKVKGKNDLKYIFLDLAEKEAEHKEVIKKLAMQYDIELYDTSGIGRNSNINHTFAHLFVNPTSSPKVKLPKDVLRIAQKLNNDIIQFFHDLSKETVGNTKSLIHRIIEQEKANVELIGRFL